MEKYVTFLSESGPPSVEILGGKGLNLVRLTQAGLPVPDGCVIGTDTNEAFNAANDLAAKLDGIVHSIVPDGTLTVEGAEATIKPLFDPAIVTQLILKAIIEAYEALGEPPVVVRSSATAGDLPSMSLDGQDDSYLNIVGHDQLSEKIKDCWLSLWNIRAIACRQRQNVPQEALRQSS